MKPARIVELEKALQGSLLGRMFLILKLKRRIKSGKRRWEDERDAVEKLRRLGQDDVNALIERGITSFELRYIHLFSARILKSGVIAEVPLEEALLRTLYIRSHPQVETLKWILRGIPKEYGRVRKRLVRKG